MDTGRVVSTRRLATATAAAAVVFIFSEERPTSSSRSFHVLGGTTDA